MHSVYVLQSKKDGALYVGYTKDIHSRLNLHNTRQVASTRSKVPWKLIYLESYISQKDAMRRELYLKTGWGRRYIQKTLEDTFNR